MQNRINAIRDKLEEELKVLTHEMEVELPLRIEEARAKGDLSENAEYESAKERQGFVAVRLQQLQARHAKLSGIDLSQVDPKTIGLYSTVTMKETESGKEYTYELVLPEEMDIKKGMISIMSPIGQQLRGSKTGDEVEIVTPARTFEVKILAFINILGEKF